MQAEKSGFIDLNEGQVYYEMAGSGDVVVLSHAGFLDSGMFDAQWEMLSADYTVIRFDMRGYGQSSPVAGPVSRRDDLMQVLAHLDVTSAHFVGCSLSGQVVIDVALEHPALVKSLTVVGSTPSGFEMGGPPPRYLMEMVEAQQQGEVALASELQIRIWVDGESREPDAVDATLRQHALEMNRRPVELLTFIMGDLQPANPLSPPALDRLGELACPVLVVAGTLEHPEVLRAAEIMASEIPTVQKVLIEDTAHVPSFERPAVFNPLLMEFLRGV